MIIKPLGTNQALAQPWVSSLFVGRSLDPTQALGYYFSDTPILQSITFLPVCGVMPVISQYLQRNLKTLCVWVTLDALCNGCESSLWVHCLHV